MEKRPHVIVVGAGASGMAAALSAAVSGASVCLLESHQKPGRSIMVSGNGRCNFANADLSPDRYNDPAFVAACMGAEPLDRILDFFGNLGLWWCTDEQGRLFPRSRAAASVLDVMLRGLAHYGVDLHTGNAVADVAHRAGGRWDVALDDGERMEADAVIWAAGGGSAGGIARALGIAFVEERAALCPVACDPKPPRELDGVRANCAVELLDGRGRSVWRDEGEVLFRTYGLSGIVVFDLSRLARPGDRVVLDLMPDVDERRLADVLEGRKRLPVGHGGAEAFLDGALHPKIARCLMARTCPRGDAANVDAAQLARRIKRWEFGVRGPADETHAQVTQGGLALEAFDPATLRCRGHAGLYACGEALDVDGACGGLNLAWAWVSGMVAGVSAARDVEGTGAKGQ